MTELDLLAHAAYALLLLCYLMRDILWLRLFSVAAGLLIIPYYYLQPESLWPCIAWNAAFIAVNIYWITRLLIERRPVHFSPEEQRLYDEALRALKPCHARKLFEAARWERVPCGKQIMTQGQPLNTLMLIADGRFSIERDGILLDEVGEGRFIGSYTFLKNLKGCPAPVTSIAAKASRLAVWDNDKLRALIDNDVEFSTAIEANLGLELAHLLDHARTDLEFAIRMDQIAKTQLQEGSVARDSGLGAAAAG
jgi:CRP-like cAMP-binding protein